ncbi:hypothetical protein NL676_010523 [Syzygium grande]|nr:hypothetical protein NL676_010523 [Syzygium grande]
MYGCERSRSQLSSMVKCRSCTARLSAALALRFIFTVIQASQESSSSHSCRTSAFAANLGQNVQLFNHHYSIMAPPRRVHVSTIPRVAGVVRRPRGSASRRICPRQGWGEKERGYAKATVEVTLCGL